ncbi:MAG TPA: dethiobiotin synthase [Nocardioides sp.]|nr:dethiobiotin synthase [Nocardioides sp.]
MTARFVVVTGTDTGVGKTIAVATLAAVAALRGERVAVVKPVQTGIGGSEPDVADAVTVEALTGQPVVQLVGLDDPLAPDVAARRQGVAIPPVADHLGPIRDLAGSHDTVIVEGAGGLLVRLDAEGGTLLDLADGLSAAGERVEVVVVARAGLGTLNHTELTVRALRERRLEPAGIIIGSWPQSPGLAEACNREDLPRVTGVPLIAVLPEGAGALDRATFLARAPEWFGATA